MACVYDEGGGRKRVMFTGLDGQRRGVRLGKTSVRKANDFKDRVKSILSDLEQGAAHDKALSQWIASLSPKMHHRLAKAKLVKPREQQAGSLTSTLGVSAPA